MSIKDRYRRINVKHDASNANSWAERQMDKDTHRKGVAVREECLTCSVFSLTRLLVMLDKIK